LPRGQLLELIGSRSSGRFSTVLSALAATTSAGEAVALVDLGDSLDPQLAVAAGADLERLLWVRPKHLKQALVSTEVLLVSGFPLVIVDLGNPPVPGGRGTEASWLRLARAVESHQAALLVSSPYRVSGPAAIGVVRTDRKRAIWSGRDRAPRILLGLSSRLALQKLRRQNGNRAEALQLTTSEALNFG
jgi:NAD(P)H-dependent FMN reductase